MDARTRMAEARAAHDAVPADMMDVPLGAVRMPAAVTRHSSPDIADGPANTDIAANLSRDMAARALLASADVLLRISGDGRILAVQAGNAAMMRPGMAGWTGERFAKTVIRSDHARACTALRAGADAALTLRHTGAGGESPIAWRLLMGDDGDYLALGRIMGSDFAGETAVAAGSLKAAVRAATDRVERACILSALAEAGDNRASAAERLGLSRQGLYAKLHRHGIGNLGSGDSASQDD